MVHQNSEKRAPRIEEPPIKTRSPVPDELIRLGFLDYAKRLKELGHRCLFPELVAPGRKNDTGDRFYKSFVPLLKAETGLGDQLWGRAIHALRHGFSDTLKQKGIEMSIIEDITGHLGRTEGDTRYTNIASLTVMKRQLMCIRSLRASATTALTLAVVCRGKRTCALV
ncbi:hypothetical protein HED50_09370 [Ochrobactrum oryzae]|nr:hypothetical protein [Brucella oryzae]